MKRIAMLIALVTQLFMGCGTSSEDTAASTTDPDTSGRSGALVLDLTCGGKTCIGTEGQ